MSHTTPNRTGTIDISGSNSNKSLAIGRKIKNIRIEGEILWASYDIDDAEYSSISLPNVDLGTVNRTNKISGDIDTTTLALNVYYDFETGTKFVPYVGVGIGASKINQTNKVTLLGQTGEGGGSDTTSIYQAEVGTSYSLSDQTKVFASYRFVHFEDIEMKQASGSVVSAHSNWKNKVRVGIIHFFE